MFGDRMNTDDVSSFRDFCRQITIVELKLVLEEYRMLANKGNVYYIECYHIAKDILNERL